MSGTIIPKTLCPVCTGAGALDASGRASWSSEVTQKCSNPDCVGGRIPDALVARQGEMRHAAYCNPEKGCTCFVHTMRLNGKL